MIRKNLTFKKILKASTKKIPLFKNLKNKKVVTKESLDFKYRGRSSKWLILQLSEECSLEDKYDIVINDIKNIFGNNVEFFIPVHREKLNNKIVNIVLFEEYVFIKCNDTINETLFKERTENIIGPVMSSGKCSFVCNKDINKFKDDLQDVIKSKIPKKGQMVIPREGSYKNLEGKVVLVDKNKMIATVVFEKRSRIVEVPINIINLEIIK